MVLPAGLTELMLNCGIFCGDDIQQHMASKPLGVPTAQVGRDIVTAATPPGHSNGIECPGGDTVSQAVTLCSKCAVTDTFSA